VSESTTEMAGVMTDPVTGEIIDQKELAERLLAQTKEQGVSLVGPGGLLTQLTRNVLETGPEAELSEHLWPRAWPDSMRSQHAQWHHRLSPIWVSILIQARSNLDSKCEAITSRRLASMPRWWSTFMFSGASISLSEAILSVLASSSSSLRILSRSKSTS
jgi:hypothetical protein